MTIFKSCNAIHSPNTFQCYKLCNVTSLYNLVICHTQYSHNCRLSVKLSKRYNSSASWQNDKMSVRCAVPTK